MPTLLFKDEKKQQGEIFRIVPAYDREDDVENGIWDDFCITDIDAALYAGRPITEVVFWHEREEVELPAWRVTMKKSRGAANEQKLVVQS